MRKFLRLIKRFFDKLLGNLSDELFWSFRHLMDKNWTNGYIAKSSLDHPHRKLLTEKISAYAPFENVLEIGCASGPNLYLLANKFPHTNFYGVDISSPAIEAAKNFFREKGLNNATFYQGRAEDLSKFKDKSLDLVFTDGTLIYVGPNKIVKVLKEMQRVSRGAIIMNELHTDFEPIRHDSWIHNYKDVLGKAGLLAKSKFTKIPPAVWSGNWAKYGYIIEVAF